MSKRIKYYFSQGKGIIKREFLIVIGISIALGMIAGVGYLSDSYIRQLYSQSVTDVIDLEFDFQPEITTTQRDTNVPKLNSMVEENSPLDILDKTLFSEITEESFFLYSNTSELDYIPFRMHFYENEFYESQRFSSYFTITEGGFPVKDNQFLIDSFLAEKWNFSVNGTYDIDLLYADPWDLMFNYDTSSMIELNFTTIEISGIYSISHYSYHIRGRNYYTPYLDPQYNENVESDYWKIFGNNNPLFGFYNYSYSTGFPVWSNFTTEFKSLGDRYISYETGICYLYDREDIKMSQLTSVSQKLDSARNIYYINSPIDISVNDYLSWALMDLYFISSMFNAVFQVLNIPIIIFALVIGTFTLKTAQKSRVSEFLLLRCKGTPDNMIRNQILFEGLLIGISSAIIGSLLGLGLFYIFKASFLPIISVALMAEELAIPLFITIYPIRLAFIIGICITQIASIVSYIYIRRLSTDQLLTSLGDDSVDANLNENSLFKNNEEKKITLVDAPFFSGNIEESNPHFLSNIPDNMEKPSKKKKNYTLRKHRSLYKSSTDKKNKKLKRRMKIRKISWLLITISLIPVILNILIYIGNKNIYDPLTSLAEFLNDYLGQLLMMFLTIISPILLTVGIIRFVAKENSVRFAKISKRFASWFLHDKDELCALNMVRKKQYVTSMLLIGIFVSLLSFTNIAANSVIRHDSILQNIYVGGDLKATYSNLRYIETFDYVGLDPGSPLQNGSDFLKLEDVIKNYTTIENKTLFKNVATVFSITKYQSWAPYGNFQFMTNLTALLEIISENNKYEPSRGEFAQIQEVIEYNADNNNIYPGIIVNSQYLTINRKNIGDLATIEYDAIINNTMTRVSFSAVILSTLSVIPGTDNGGSSTSMLLCDIGSLNMGIDVIPSLYYYQILDVDTSITQNVTKISNSMDNATRAFSKGFTPRRMAFYDLEWNKMNYDMMGKSFGIYGIFYYEFTVLGILISLGIAIFLLYLRKSDKHFQGVLLARGYGKKGVTKLLLVELFIIFFISILTGLFSGILYSTIFVKNVDQLMFYNLKITLPIFANVFDIIWLTLLIPFLSLAIYMFIFQLESKKKYAEYFHKF